MGPTRRQFLNRLAAAGSISLAYEAMTGRSHQRIVTGCWSTFAGLGALDERRQHDRHELLDAGRIRVGARDRHRDSPARAGACVSSLPRTIPARGETGTSCGNTPIAASRSDDQVTRSATSGSTFMARRAWK